MESLLQNLDVGQSVLENFKREKVSCLHSLLNKLKLITRTVVDTVITEPEKL